MEKGNFVIPKIRLSLWQKTIIAMEDAHVLPGGHWLVWYDPLILLLIACLFYLSYRSPFFGPDSDLTGYLFVSFFMYFIIMTIRHYSWLEGHAQDILENWGIRRGFKAGSPFFNQSLNYWLGWKFYLYIYSVQKVINEKSLLSLLAAEFFREKPGWAKGRRGDNRYYRTLTFAYFQHLPFKDNFAIVIKSKGFKQKIFKTSGLSHFPNITGVNEFDQRFSVWSTFGQNALLFLNPIVILALIHLSLPHEILVLNNEVLISSHRHFTRKRVLEELNMISMAIYDAHGGRLENADWQETLDYFRTNPYDLHEEMITLDK